QPQPELGHSLGGEPGAPGARVARGPVPGRARAGGREHEQEQGEPSPAAAREAGGSREQRALGGERRVRRAALGARGRLWVMDGHSRQSLSQRGAAATFGGDRWRETRKIARASRAAVPGWARGPGPEQRSARTGGLI